MRVLTLNVCGLRASQKKGLFDWLARQKADYICFQEVRAEENQIESSLFTMNGYTRYLSSAEKKGYSGVCIYTKHKPVKISRDFGSKAFSKEGRFISLSFKKYDIVSVYFPSGSSGEERQNLKYKFMSKFESYLKKVINKKKMSIICGDWNIAHKKIDLKNWRSNQKNSGFLLKERRWLDKITEKYGFVDVFREVNNLPDQYTWWSNRGRAWEKNVGWRIDYHIATPNIKDKILKAAIYKNKRFSDHSPLIIDYDV